MFRSLFSAQTEKIIEKRWKILLRFENSQKSNQHGKYHTIYWFRAIEWKLKSICTIPRMFFISSLCFILKKKARKQKQENYSPVNHTISQATCSICIVYISTYTIFFHSTRATIDSHTPKKRLLWWWPEIFFKGRCLGPEICRDPFSYLNRWVYYIYSRELTEWLSMSDERKELKYFVIY